MKKAPYFLCLSLSAVLLSLSTACAPAAPPAPTPVPAAPTTPAVVATPVLAATPTSALAATPTPSEAQRTAQLIEGAKKEGKLAIWTTLTDKDFNPFIKAFKDKYPFIEIEYWRSNVAGITEKVLAEAMAGKSTVDVIGTMGIDSLAAFKEANILMKYDYPATRDLPPALRDPEGLWMAHQVSAYAITYNTNLVSPVDAPKSWEDLLLPKWKGQIAIEENAEDFLIALWKAWGKEKAVSYLEGVKKNDPLLKTGHTAMIEMLAAGEFKAAVELFVYDILAYQKKNAPLEWVRTNPVVGRISIAGIAAKAPHPNAAKLYMDWWGSEEGQKVYEATTGRFSPKGKVFGEVTRGLNLVVFGPEMLPNVPEATEAFRRIIWPR